MMNLKQFVNALVVTASLVVGCSFFKPATVTAAPLLYVSGVNNGLVSTVTSTGVVSIFKSGLGGLPAGIDFDAAGNLYVMNFGNPSTIQKITPGGTLSTFATGFNAFSPRGLTFNPADGLLYVFDYGQGKIHKVSSSGVVSPFANVPGASNGVFVGSDLYVTDDDSGNIMKVTSGGVVTTFASGLSGNPVGITYDGSDFFVTAHTGGGFLYKVTSGGAVSTVASGLGNTGDVLYDPSTNNLIIADTNNNRLLQVTHGGAVSTYASGVTSAYNLRFGPVPEPASLVLLATGAVMMLRRQMRNHV